MTGHGSSSSSSSSTPQGKQRSSTMSKGLPSSSSSFLTHSKQEEHMEDEAYEEDDDEGGGDMSTMSTTDRQLPDEQNGNGNGNDNDDKGQGTSSGPQKKKIRRVRPLRSCLSCNKRKIKCDRTAPACGPCTKRGEGEKCSLGAGQPILQNSAAILERLHQLESRVEELEYQHQEPHYPTSIAATASNNGQDEMDTGVAGAASASGGGTHLHHNRTTSNASDLRSNGTANAGGGETVTPNTPQVLVDRSRHSLQLDSQQQRWESLTADGTSDDPPKDDTEEAAMVLESLCNTSTNLKALKGNNSSYPTPASLSSATDENRARRSTILIDNASVDLTIPGAAVAMQRAYETRQRVLRSSHFPSRQFSDHLIANFFNTLDVYWHVHINFLFEDEYQQFWSLNNEGKDVDSVDPAWVALYLLTLALGLQVSKLPLPAHLGLSEQYPTADELLSLSDIWIDDAEEMLKAADWSRKAQIRTLQTIILLNAYQSLTELADPAGATWNAAAIRIAQLLGFHELSESTTKVIADDPAVPTGNNVIKVQLAKRIWLSLLIMEHVYTFKMGLALPLASTPYSTTMPLNVNDVDLLSQPLVEKPKWKHTNSSPVLLRWTLSQIHRRLAKLTSDAPASEAYTHVLAIDAELRRWMSEAPAEPLPDEANDFESYKTAVWRHRSTLAEVYGELLHLHRPYMVRGYTDPRYSLSTKICLESAKFLCEVRQYLQDSIVDERFWWSQMRWLSAAIVIYIDLFQAIDAGCTEEVLSIKKAELPGIYSIFKTRQRSHYLTVRNFARTAMGVLDNLSDAEQKKKATMLSRQTALGTSSNRPPGSSSSSAPGDASQSERKVDIKEDDESVGRVFQRIARTMVVADASSPRSSVFTPPSGSPNSNVRPNTLPPMQTVMHPRGPSSYRNSSSSQKNLPAVGGGGQQSGGQYRGSPSSANPPANMPQHQQQQQQQMAFSPRSMQTGLTSPSLTLGPGPQQYSSMSNMHAGMPSSSSSQGANLYAQHNGQQYQGMQTIPPYPQLHHPTPAPPISWDTSVFFNPDPSALLQTMGYSNDVTQVQQPHSISGGSRQSDSIYMGSGTSGWST